jgi:hypothetical protein
MTQPRRPGPGGSGTLGGRTPPENPGPVVPRRPPPDPSDTQTPPPLDDDAENAYLLLTNMLRDWGLDTLAPEVLRLLQEGYTQSQIPILLQDSEPYKQRFAGNETRRAAGLSVLSPAEYLQVERSYRQIMMNAGLPSGFYDQSSDFNDWIGNDVAPVEVQRRVGEAVDATVRMDENSRAAFRDWYGLDDNDLAAYILDPNRGRDVINRVVHGGRIAGAARGYGVDLTQSQAERYGAMTGDDYLGEAQAFGRLAATGERLSGIYTGEDYGAEEAAGEVWQNSGEAERRRRQLVAREQSEFGGRGQASSTALGSGGGQF